MAGRTADVAGSGSQVCVGVPRRERPASRMEPPDHHRGIAIATRRIGSTVRQPVVPALSREYFRPAYLLRTEFDVPDGVARARIYSTAHGATNWS